MRKISGGYPEIGRFAGSTTLHAIYTESEEELAAALALHSPPNALLTRQV